jgi:hypothetical protein
MLTGAWYGSGVMRTIKTTAKVDDSRSLRLDADLPSDAPGSVRVIVLIPDADLAEAADEPTEHEWLRLLMAGGAFDDLANPREDIYSIEDGEPFVDEG